MKHDIATVTGVVGIVGASCLSATPGPIAKYGA